MISLVRAREIASQVVDELWPYVEDIEVVGEVRRCRPVVGRLEFLMTPRIGAGRLDLWGVAHDQPNLFDEAFQRLVDAGKGYHYWEDDKQQRQWSDTWRRAYWEDAPVTFWSPSRPESWGMAMLLHTGPVAYVEMILGLLPDGVTLRNDVLYRNDTEVLVTPEEETVFRLIGIDPPSPHQRRG